MLSALIQTLSHYLDTDLAVTAIGAPAWTLSITRIAPRLEVGRLKKGDRPKSAQEAPTTPPKSGHMNGRLITAN